MAYGNNRKGKQPRAHFQLAGGSIIKFRHPYLAGQIKSGSESVIDEIDISACMKLEGRFFEANPSQDSAKQVVLVDGSTATICNKLLNGVITIPAVRTTGRVGTGDFIACCQLIKSVGDSVGGILYKTDFINGMALTKLYYGVTVQNCPDDVSEGNDVAVYNIKLLYAGWIEVQSDTAAENKKKIWATGNAQGLEAYFHPYSLQNSDGDGGTSDKAFPATNSGLIGSKLTDDTTAANNVDNETEIGVAKSSDGGYQDIIESGTAVTS